LILKKEQNKRLIILLTFSLILGSASVFSQENLFTRNSITANLGYGFQDGQRESGIGYVYSVGWQKEFGKKKRLRLNPNVIFGEFTPFGFSDVRDKFYRSTSLGVNLHYDLLKYKSVSLVTTAGSYMHYTRGLLGTGGWSGVDESEYFNALYFGLDFSVGLRVNPPKSRAAYELHLLNLHGGNKRFFLGYLMFGIEYKFKNHENLPINNFQ